MMLTSMPMTWAVLVTLSHLARTLAGPVSGSPTSSIAPSISVAISSPSPTETPPAPTSRPTFGNSGKPFWGDVKVADTYPQGLPLGAVLQAIAVRDKFIRDAHNGFETITVLKPDGDQYLKPAVGTNNTLFSRYRLWPDQFHDALAYASWPAENDPYPDDDTASPLKLMDVQDALHALTGSEAGVLFKSDRLVDKLKPFGDMWQDEEKPVAVLISSASSVKLKPSYAYGVSDFGEDAMQLTDPAENPGPGRFPKTVFDNADIAADIEVIYSI